MCYFYSQIHTLSDEETNAALGKMSVLTYLDELSPHEVHERALRTGLVLREERQEERDAAMVRRMLENLDRAEEKALQRKASALALDSPQGGREGEEAAAAAEAEGGTPAANSHRDGKHRARKGGRRSRKVSRADKDRHGRMRANTEALLTSPDRR